MKNLLKAEWFKLSRSVGCKILLICSFGLGVFDAAIPLIVGSTATGYEVFTLYLGFTLAYSVFGYLLSAVFICGEFSNRSFGMSLLSGSPRRKVFLAKIIVFFAGLIPILLVCTGTTTIIFSIWNGFGHTLNMVLLRDILLQLCYSMIGYAALGAVVILIATITRKVILTVGIGIGMTYVLLSLQSNLGEIPFVKYLYTSQLQQLTYYGDLFPGGFFSGGTFLAATIPTFILAIFIAMFVFEKIELK